MFGNRLNLRLIYRRYKESFSFDHEHVDAAKHLEFSDLLYSRYTTNFMRQVLLQIFSNQMKVFEKAEVIRIALIGGIDEEPEIKLLLDSGKKIELTIFGVEHFDIYLDLNESNLESHKYHYDLILCSQVFEHIWNHKNAFKVINQLMRESSFLWLTCPTSNRYHGSPDYFSAGLTDKYFKENLKLFDIETVSSGVIGTKRNYLATHLLPVWLTYKGHKNPFLYAFEEKEPIARILLSMKYVFRNLYLNSQSRRLTLAPNSATETWVFAHFSARN